MMNRLKNSIYSKVLQVLLIGYFLISSLNISQNLTGIATKDTNVHKKENVMWSVFKKLLKCSNNCEEYEDNDNEAGESNGKIKVSLDYIMPCNAGITFCYAYRYSVNKIYLAAPDLNGILYNKIHVPPPEII